MHNQALKWGHLFFVSYLEGGKKRPVSETWGEWKLNWDSLAILIGKLYLKSFCPFLAAMAKFESLLSKILSHCVEYYLNIMRSKKDKKMVE